jgi:hypothetical protein
VSGAGAIRRGEGGRVDRNFFEIYLSHTSPAHTHHKKEIEKKTKTQKKMP